MKRRFVGVWLTLGMVLAACGQDAAPEVVPVPQADHVGAAVVISQVYGGGGNSGATLRNDFVELFNRSDAEQSLAGLSLQYASAAGTGNFGANSGLLVNLPDETLEPGGYFLVQLAGGSNGAPLPTADATGTINISGTAGKIALATGTTSLGCNGGSTPCSSEQLERVVDLVGFGSANFSEGSAAAPALNTTTAALRKGEGCVDTDDNAADFTAGAPTPRNSSSPAADCEGGGNGGGDGGDDGAPTEPTPIYDIQGAGHTSPLVNQSVSTSGVVTAVDSNGFYLQDPQGDGDDATSDAVFVFTSTAPSVSVGDAVSVSGTVSEFTPGGASSRNLSITQIGSPTVTVSSTATALPAPVVIGAGGRVPPTRFIDNDNFAVFDPQEDGIDFFESLEGMRVTVPSPVAVSPTNRFGEIFTVTDGGRGATGLSGRGTLNISPDDFNPERVQLQADAGILPGFTMPQVDVGAAFEDVTGVVSYGFGNFEVLVTAPFGVVTPSSLEPEVTDLTATKAGLTVATYNVLNLDPNDADDVDDRDIADGQFSAIAAQIVTNLRAPDILALQEVQDNSGSVNNGVVAADLTYETLIAAITAAGGPEYAFFELPPQNNQDGGQPGGNIRVGFLYNPARVDLLEETAVRIGEGNSAFDASRKSLAADFSFNGETVTIVNNHFASKGGSSPLFGTLQPSVSSAPGEGQENPAVNGGVDDRRGQAEAVKAYVDARLATDADAKIVVLGDFNEFEFISPLEILEGSLVNLTETLPENERYSYIFEGNSQSLDHILVSRALAGSAFDAVHVNSEFAVQASDHDPLVTRLEIAPQSPQEALTELKAQVQALSDTLNRGQVRSLQSDLDTAARQLERGQTAQAARSLRRFEDTVRRLVRQGALTEAQGQPLVDASSALRAQL